MRLGKQILVLVLAFAMFHSLVGQGLVVLCADESGAHTAFELATADSCPVKHAEKDCGEAKLHFDDPANHPSSDNPCTDTPVQLSLFHTDHNPESNVVLQATPSHPAGVTGELLFVVVSIPQNHFDNSPVPPSAPSITSTVLLI